MDVVEEHAVRMAVAAGAQKKGDRILGRHIAGINLLAGPKLADHPPPVETAVVLVVLTEAEQLFAGIQGVGERPRRFRDCHGHLCIGHEQGAIRRGHLETEGLPVDAHRQRPGAYCHGSGVLGFG